MALMKETTNENNGVITTYHKLGELSLLDGAVGVLLESYTSKDYRENGVPVGHRRFYFDISLEEEESMGIRKLIYSKIKEMPEWQDAEDC